MSEKNLALIKKDTVDVVAAKIRQFMEKKELHLPPNYSTENALKSAWLVLQETRDKNGKPALEVCTRESIANSLLDMVVQGLNPLKKQCYFIVYGNQLFCQRSYFGDIAVVKRVLPNANIWFNVIYEGDEFEFTSEKGIKKIIKHEQKISNMNPDKIVGAYCVIENNGKVLHTEVMTMEQIKKSWNMSKQYNPKGGNTPHHTYPDQMALRTVIRRACKYVINSASDDYLLLHHYHRTDDAVTDAEIKEEMATQANKEIIDVEPETIEEVEEPINEEMEQKQIIQQDTQDTQKQPE